MESSQYLFQYIKEKYDFVDWEEEYENLVAQNISNFTAVLSKFWIKSSRNIHRFKKSNVEWLKKPFIMPSIRQSIPKPPPFPSISNIGRPKKLFSDCSDRSKRRKI